MGNCFSLGWIRQNEIQLDYMSMAHNPHELRKITEVSVETDSGYEAGTEMEPLHI